ncbi:MAG: 4Fe-4S dicluster domain-containing protein [bacterium]
MVDISYNKHEKAFMIYPALCTGCRACQVACKNWNQLPAIKTENRGTFENPRDLNPTTYTKIKFNEYSTGSDTGGSIHYGISWLFLKQQCFHCTEATCMLVCPSQGALTRTPEGIVVHNPDKCIGCKYCVFTCPFKVPQFDTLTQTISKCHLCHDRVAHNLIPACAKACPTGAIQYGDRDALINEAKASGANRIYGEKELKGLHVMYALPESPEKYGLPEDPRVPRSVYWWKNIFKPLIKWGLPLTILACLVHFWFHGPHVIEQAKGGPSND